MRKHNFVFATISLLILLCSTSQAATCDENNGAMFVQRGDLESAYQMLRSCEKKKNASAETLTNFAMLYGSLDYGDLSEEEALKKVWLLLHRAAALGHKEALESVIRLYAQGESKILVRPNAEKQQCLERLAKSGGHQGQSAFKRCLAKQE